MRKHPRSRWFSRTAALIATVAGACATAMAQPSIVTLTNGTRLHATILDQSPESIRLLDPILGELTIPRASIVAIIVDAAPDPLHVQPPAPQPETSEPATEPATDATELADNARLSFFRAWGFEAELGFTGSEGNTERFNLRAGLRGTRETDHTRTQLRLSYAYATTDGDKSEDRFLSTLRNDWKLGESPWRIFAEGEFEYDDFQNWDWRWAAFGGLGYAFIDNDRTFFLARIGAGVNQFVGGDDNAVSPEALLGLEFNHKLTERQSLESEATLFPSLDDFGDYRAVGRAAYSILVDPDINMSLRLGVENRYNSKPDSGSRKNDLDYFLMLVWSF